MLSTIIVFFVLATTTVVGLMDFAWIVAPLAKATILLVPAIFMLSLIIGFALRRRSWFR